MNNGKFLVDKLPDMKSRSAALSNNFFYILALNQDFNKINNELSRLEISYDSLFPRIEEVIEEKSFEYEQSINQYFYFVEDASING